MKLRVFSPLLALLTTCGWMLVGGFASAQDEPRVEPIIRHPDRYDQDFNGIIDTLDDLIAQAIAAGEAWRERTVVVTLWVPCQEWHLDQARMLGGPIGFVYEYVCYGFSARLPVWAVPHLARNLGGSLCIIESPTRGGLCMDVASKIVRVRPVVWDTYDYRGDPWSSVAVIDTGIDTAHDDLGDDGDNKANDPDDWYDVGAPGHDWDFTDAERDEWSYKVVGWWDKENDSQSSNPVDFGGDGHGTHVSGILSGFGLVNADYNGTAPRTRLVGVRMDPDDGDDHDTDLAQAKAAMEEVVKQRVAYRIKACNMSWYFQDAPTLSDNAETMAASGILPVVAAGNNHPIYDPALSPKALTVGATNDNDELTKYSAWGPVGGDPLKPDVAAPGGAGSGAQGKLITSCDNDPHDAYHEMYGTSMAAPIAAGTAAMVIQALGYTGDYWYWGGSDHPRLVKSLILMTAWETQRGEDADHTPELNRGGKDRKEGYGRVCADAAIEAASMNYTVGLTAKEALCSLPTEKKVWARKLSFDPADEDCTLRLKVPAGVDYDLYLYSLEPDEHGEPVILHKSTIAAAGQSEQIVRAGGPENQTVYVVVKDATPPPSGYSYRSDFTLESWTSSIADEVWIKDSDSDDGTLSCVKTSAFGSPPQLSAPPSSPDIRSDPALLFPGFPVDIYVTVRNKTDHNISDATVDVYLYEPTTAVAVPTDATKTWQQTNVSIPAEGSKEVGPFRWDKVETNRFGEAYWFMGVTVTTPRDGIKLWRFILEDDNVAARCLTPASLFADANPGSPGFVEHFDLSNSLDVGAVMSLSASRLAIPPDWGFYIEPSLDTPVHLDPGQTLTGEVYLCPPVSSSMGVSGIIDIASSLIPDDNSNEYDLTGSMTIGLCTDEEFSDSDMSDWDVNAVGTHVFVDTQKYVSEPASMRVEGSPAEGAYAWCTSPHVNLDFLKPYRLRFSLNWDNFSDARLVEFGHVRLSARSPSQALEYDPDGDWLNLVPIGPSFDSMLPSGAWGEVAVEVNPAEFEYKIWVNGTEVGTAPYDRWLEPVSRLRIEDQASSGSVLVANFDDIAPVGTPPEVEPVVYRSSSPSGWINPRWNMISIPLDPAGSWDAAHILGFDPTSHLFGWDKFGKTTTYYGVQFTQMLPGEGYKFHTETEVSPPTYLGTKTHRPFEIALPKMGWSWIGCPSDSPVAFADCEIRNEATGLTRRLSDDRFAADPWMNWAFYWWDSGKETWSYAGALEFPGIDDSLRPWRGYMTWQRTDDLTLIVP